MKQSLAAFAALVPIFALILLGYGLRRYRIVPDEFWVPMEKLTYYIFFPLLLLDNLSKANLGDLSVIPMALALVSAILAVTLGLYLLRRRLNSVGTGFQLRLPGIGPAEYLRRSGGGIGPVRGAGGYAVRDRAWQRRAAGQCAVRRGAVALWRRTAQRAVGEGGYSSASCAIRSSSA